MRGLWHRRRARDHVERGAGYLVEQRLDEALLELEHAAALTPGDWRIWYDLGLLHKWRREWQRSRDCNRAAVELGGDANAHWNLGIAATAVRDWAAARRAWRHVGVAIPDGDGPVDLELGLCVVRLHAGVAAADGGDAGHRTERPGLPPRPGGGDDGRAETVWCVRLDPARARVVNIPLVESGHRWRDIVLHDGAPALRGSETPAVTPIGEVVASGAGGRTIAVFDELERLEPSPFVTWRASVFAPVETDVIDLVSRFEEPLRSAEDWTATIQPRCDACRRGDPEGDHDHGSDDDDWHEQRVMAFAARSRDEVVERLEAWAGARRGRSWRRLDGGD